MRIIDCHHTHNFSLHFAVQPIHLLRWGRVFLQPSHSSQKLCSRFD